jgi:FlaA1/EpsC-like NDP-sugar epimerase
MLAVITCFILSIYFLSPEKISRIVLINFSVISTSLVLVVKFLVRSFLRSQRAKGKNLRYVLLVGDGHQIDDNYKVVKGNPELGLKIRAWVDSNGLAEKYGVPVEEKCSESLFRRLSSDYIVIGYSFKNYAKVDEVLKVCSNELLNITVLPDLSYALIGHEISDFSGIPVISINQPHFSSKSIIIKRLFDFVLSGISLFGLILEFFL